MDKEEIIEDAKAAVFIIYGTKATQQEINLCIEFAEIQHQRQIIKAMAVKSAEIQAYEQIEKDNLK